MRESLFISHARPDDNEFSIWLYSRLKLLGYKVWCDLKELSGERDYWNNIQTQIRDNSIKVLLVVSKNTFKRDGVLDEYEYAKSVMKEIPDLKDFIIMLKIDDSSFSARIGQNRFNHILFADSWADGFKELIEKLQSDGVTRDNDISNDAADKWKESQIAEKSAIQRTLKEEYYSNWWQITEIPETLYIYQYSNEVQAQAIFDECDNYPIQRTGNALATFDQDISFISHKNDDLEIKPSVIHQINIKSIVDGFESSTFPTQSDAENILKRLLNRSFHLMMKRRGLYWYELASKSNCYFFPKGKIKKNKSTILYPNNKKRTKNLVGKYGEAIWHFAVSARTQIRPSICFSLRSHILFSNDGLSVWQNKDFLHAARRKKGRSWFNAEWRDQLFAFINALKAEDGTITIGLNKDFTLKMQAFTQRHDADFGYYEPETKTRQDALIDYVDELQYYNEINEDSSLDEQE